MQRIGRRLLLATCLGALAVTAQAQPYGPGAMRNQPMMAPGAGGAGPMGGPGMGGPGIGRMSDPAGYLASLEQQLAISPQQKPAWNEYAQTVTGVAGQMQGVHQYMWESMPTASWQERQGMMNRMFQARQASYDLVHAAALKLMEVLTPAQRNQATGLLPGLMPRGPAQRGRAATQ